MSQTRRSQQTPQLSSLSFSFAHILHTYSKTQIRHTHVSSVRACIFICSYVHLGIYKYTTPFVDTIIIVSEKKYYFFSAKLHKYTEEKKDKKSQSVSTHTIRWIQDGTLRLIIEKKSMPCSMQAFKKKKSCMDTRWIPWTRHSKYFKDKLMII